MCFFPGGWWNTEYMSPAARQGTGEHRAVLLTPRVPTTPKQVECKFNLSQQSRRRWSLSVGGNCTVVSLATTTRPLVNDAGNRQSARFARWRADAIFANIQQCGGLCSSKRPAVVICHPGTSWRRWSLIQIRICAAFFRGNLRHPTSPKRMNVRYWLRAQPRPKVIGHSSNAPSNDFNFSQ